MAHEDLLQITKHHLYPKVHGVNIRHNERYVPLGLHRAWHALVGLRTPLEAVVELVQRWTSSEEVSSVFVRTRHGEAVARPLAPRIWGRRKDLAAFNLVFPTTCPREMLQLWTWQWTPKDYTQCVTAVIDNQVISILPDVPDTALIQRIAYRQECKLREMQLAQAS